MYLAHELLLINRSKSLFIKVEFEPLRNEGLFYAQKVETKKKTPTRVDVLDILIKCAIRCGLPHHMQQPQLPSPLLIMLGVGELFLKFRAQLFLIF